MPAATFIVEAPSGEIVLVNEQARQMIEPELGRPMPSELESIGDLYDSGDFELLYPDVRPYELEEWPLMRSIRSGEVVRDEIADFLVGGTRIPVRCNSSPVYDHEGCIVAGVAVFYEMAEQKRAEEELRESSRRTKNTLESITDAFFALDREWRVTYINERTLDSLQYRQQDEGAELTHEDLLGKIMWEVFPEAVDSVFYHKYHEAVREHKTVQFEAYAPWNDRWFEVNAYPSEEGLSVYYRDVTERKWAEEQLAYHARLLENIHDAVLATDERFALTAWNKGAEQMFGWRT